ncbi:MAG: hypothetical protein JRJ47_11365 [Deltaproteobacteria bacterium]|nr:hypothetical protein [Deltaproteobacteria bacterium]
MKRNKGTNALVFCFLVVFLITGCATTKKITADITGMGGGLKKKMAFLPTVNKTGYGGEVFKESARAQFENTLGSFCDDIIIIDSEKVRGLLEEIPRLPSGRLDTLVLAKLGRALGLNTVLEENLFQLECLDDKRGIYGFRDDCKIVQLYLRVRVYDVESAAVLVDEIVRDEVVVSEKEWLEIKERREYHQEIANRLLNKTTSEICENVCELVSEKPWKGYFTSVSENTYILSAGTDVGLEVGDMLEVFEAGEPIKGQGGEVYLVSGPKIGEVHIKKLFNDRAEAFGVLPIEFDRISHVQLKK